MTIELFHVDAFASRPFTGNPAAVCVLIDPAEQSWMQRFAAEMNLSETAFVVPDNGGFGLRWFTPAAEVDLCGHATLASAHVLWQSGRVAPEAPVVFQTRSGELRCRLENPWITMDFPARPATACDAPPGLLAALGTEARFIGQNRMDYLVHVASEDVLRALRPDFRALKAVSARGVIITADSARREIDFVSRFFAPAVGVDEDPVTGSAHCCLGPYWSARLGRRELLACQASRRGGVIRVTDCGSRVHLAGQAVTVSRGEVAPEACALETLLQS